MTRSSLVTALALAGLVILAVAGCSADRAPTVAKPAPAPSLSATTSPSPSATPTPSSDPATWIISDSAIGPLKLGGDLASVAGALSSFTLEPADSCPNPDVRIYTSSTQSTLWVAMAPGTSTISFIGLGGDVIGSRTAPSPHTPSGAAIGTPEAQLATSEPSAVVTGDGAPTYYTEPGTGANQIDLQVYEGVVQTIVVGGAPYHVSEFCG